MLISALGLGLGLHSQSYINVYIVIAILCMLHYGRQEKLIQEMWADLQMHFSFPHVRFFVVVVVELKFIGACINSSYDKEWKVYVIYCTEAHKGHVTNSTSSAHHFSLQCSTLSLCMTTHPLYSSIVVLPLHSSTSTSYACALSM